MVTQQIWAEPAFNPAFSDPRSFLHSSGHDFKGFCSVNEEAALAGNLQFLNTWEKSTKSAGWWRRYSSVLRGVH